MAGAPSSPRADPSVLWLSEPFLCLATAPTRAGCTGPHGQPLSQAVPCWEQQESSAPGLGQPPTLPGVQCLNYHHPEPVACSASPGCHGHPSLSVLAIGFGWEPKSEFITCVRWVSCTPVAFCKSWILFLQWVHTYMLNCNSLGLSELQTSLRHGSMIKFSGPV